MLAVYWAEPGGLMWRSRRPQAHRANAGFPEVDTLLERYARTSGSDLSHIDFYRTFATDKLAVISQGAAKRLSLTEPARAINAVKTVEVLARLAIDLSDGL
jgi:aminoglycoside phosphotransferase (APT) family kinase protein